MFASLLSLCGTTTAQELFRADFETYETTPYFFRFGNKGKLGEHTYKPRWMYSHEIIDNPVVSNDGNPSAKVLKYSSMEARNYGLKFLLSKSVSIDNFKEVRFNIYQPKNVIGQETNDGEDAATKQEICIKLLCKFNTINDFKQDDGILLYQSATECTAEGTWLTYSFKFDKSLYASQLSKFTNGVVGIAILPTYNSGVTLNEDEQYVCYLDNITINSPATGIHEATYQKEAISYADGQLTIRTHEEGIASVSVYHMDGSLIITFPDIAVEGGNASLPVSLDKNKVYLVRATVGNQCYNQKISGQ